MSGAIVCPCQHTESPDQNTDEEEEASDRVCKQGHVIIKHEKSPVVRFHFLNLVCNVAV